MLPTGLRGLGFRFYDLDPAKTTSTSATGEFYLHPHYRTRRPLEALLLKAQASSDTFVTEQYANQIDAVFTKWSSSLLRDSQDMTPIPQVLADNFIGAALRPAESRVVRAGPTIGVRRNTFRQEAALSRDAFPQELRFAMSDFSKLLTAEFQVTGIDTGSMHAIALSPGQIQTRIRYELVGPGHNFYREQRVGYWQLLWERSASGEFRILQWTALDETRSHSTGPCYADIAAAALGGNASYSSQLLHGTDYWRTVLDAACGIDIYGHNGVSFGDIDGDGFDDLYVCQPVGLPHRLYRNRGDGTFEDITDASGVGVLENTACALFVDVDNDGRQDLIVVRANGPMLFLNQGGGKFRQKANAFQFATPPQGTFTGAAVADYDHDGWLDIYFCLYVYYQGTDQYKYPSPYYDAENGPPNFMMRNHRDGTFRDVTAETGLSQNNTRYSFCCGWTDFNRGGWPDLYVVNDFGRKNLYRNNGNGTFTDIAAQASVEDIGAGMSVCCFDYDNDGSEDIYVADMWTAAGERISMQDAFQKDAPAAARTLYHKHAMGNSLFRNMFRNTSQKGNASFEDTTNAAGVGVGRWAWSSDAFDFDHDGFPDLYIANGMVTGPYREDLNGFFWRQVVAYSPNEAKPSHEYEQGWSAINELIRADGTWSGYERNVFYANNGDGTFSDISGVAGLDFLEDGRAFAIADFDHDGRQEVVLKNRNGPGLRILKNVMEELPPSISFRLRGTKSNPDAIGTTITVESEARHQTRSLQAGSGFLSQHIKDGFFGLGTAHGAVRASSRWPSGLVQELRDLPANHRVWIEEGAEPSRIEPFQSAAQIATSAPDAKPQEIETLPTTAETWLLAPVEAPDFSLPDLDGRVRTLSALLGKPVLLNFWAADAPRWHEDWATFNQHHLTWAAQGLQLLSVNLDPPADAKNVRTLVREHNISFSVVLGSDDIAAIYNIVYRYLFDRHRDLSLPTSFLISTKGEILKVYQGPANPEHIEYDLRHIPQTSAERLARALPFPGVTDTIEFGRNYLSYGSVFFQGGYMDQAAASFQIALRDNPTSAEALYGIGSVYLDQQKTNEARDCFERALKLRAGYPDTLANCWNNLGLLAGRAGNRPKAIDYFLEALKLSPDHMIALNNLGSAYRQEKRWDDALKTYQRALALNSDDPEANYGLGMVFAQNDDTARAFDSLQKALKLRPVYPEALNNLGILYLRTQRRDEGVATFKECIRLVPSFEQSYLNLARVYAVEDTPEKARDVLLELLKQHPENEIAKKMLEQLGQ